MNTNETMMSSAPSSAVKENDHPVFLPAADIYESPAGVWIRCDMPGVAEEELEVTMENKVLTVSGTQMGQGREGLETLAGEYLTGVYQRSFGLSRDFDESAVKARMKDGVLEIELPKAKEARARRIPVEA
ncbi:MAG: Hsp20/alpha crystallin family protein [Luteolibacter sp.]|jgi:HSP20 family molecular chaperone IbpA|nr:Hsp20/alpha crystallin family protein [Luteolibacter sp.]